MTNYQTAVIAAALLCGSDGRWNFADTLRNVLTSMAAVPEGYEPPPQPPLRGPRRG